MSLRRSQRREILPRGYKNVIKMFSCSTQLSIRKIIIAFIFNVDIQHADYEDCSYMNASSFITFFTYMLQQNDKRFYKGLYVTFKLALVLKTKTVYLSSYSPLNEGHVSILTNSMLRTYTNDTDERIILR